MYAHLFFISESASVLLIFLPFCFSDFKLLFDVYLLGFVVLRMENFNLFGNHIKESSFLLVNEDGGLWTSFR